MATLTTSLLSTVFRCGHNSVDLNPIPHTWSGCVSRIPATSRGLDKERALLSSVYGLQRAHGLWRKRLRKSNSVVVVRGRATMDLEPTALDDVADGDSVQKVVIVGAGIAGLSCALALHRVGVKVLVLEQTSSIRASGTALTLMRNAWRALEYLGVADSLRDKSTLITGVSLLSRSGKILRNFGFDECPGGPHEARGVERKAVVESLAAQLPPGTIKLNSRVRAIQREPKEGLTKVKLENGSVFSTKVLVGCDGVRSIVGRWMGLPPTRNVGKMAIRGVAEYPDGHDFDPLFFQYLGNGPRCGVTPYSPNKVYWFVTVNEATPGRKITDPKVIQAEALDIVKDGWPEKLVELVNKTPAESLVRSSLSDRWNIPGLTPPVVKEGVTLAGDALHPMTPNLGQGGAAAIEDGVVLARCLVAALSQQGGGDAESIQKALEEYAAERQKRTLPLTVKAYVFGLLLGIGFGPVVAIRNNLALPRLLSPAAFLSHTLYDVGRLPGSEVKAF